MKERLQVYIGKNREPPQHILFYRDGVSESQFGKIRGTELSQIVEACQEVACRGQRAQITLVVVGKRHHTRFYPSPSDWQNIRSGLLVDETVVAPKQFNFYLQAHDSPIGTARNAHYVVLENESQYNADELQLIVSIHTFSNLDSTNLIHRPIIFHSRDQRQQKDSRSAYQLDMPILCVIDYGVL